MTQGRLIAVVGPSGVGKDSVMAGIHAMMPKLHLVRRVITRAPEQGGEDHYTASLDEFEEMVQNGVFAVHWASHGLRYGIPATVKYQLNKGTDCLVNFSRTALGEASAIFSHVVVLNITAKPETLTQRLEARGRETKAEIAARLEQADKPVPAGLKTFQVPNDGPLAQTVARAVALLQPANA